MSSVSIQPHLRLILTLCGEANGTSSLQTRYATSNYQKSDPTVLVGTTRCGSANDNKAVVDERLRVINVSALRVVDSGIMPQVVNSNHFAATAAIAEYGSQMIRDDNRY